MGNFTLKNVEDIRDLGVQLSKDLKFHKHISKICASARQRIYLLFRVFRTKSERALVRGYCTYVRPILEYCSPVWSPSYLGDLDKVEKIQKLFTRKLYYRLNPGHDRPVYSVRTHMYELETLERRRLLSDLKLCFAINKNLSALNFDRFFERPNRTNARVGNNMAVRLPRFRTLLRKHHFSIRTIRPWNSLPNEVINSQTISTFLKNLKKLGLVEFLNNLRWD